MEPDVLADLVELFLLLDEVLAGCVQRRCLRVDELVLLREFR